MSHKNDDNIEILKHLKQNIQTKRPSAFLDLLINWFFSILIFLEKVFIYMKMSKDSSYQIITERHQSLPKEENENNNRRCEKK